MSPKISQRLKTQPDDNIESKYSLILYLGRCSKHEWSLVQSRHIRMERALIFNCMRQFSHHNIIPLIWSNFQIIILLSSFDLELVIWRLLFTEISRKIIRSVFRSGLIVIALRFFSCDIFFEFRKIHLKSVNPFIFPFRLFLFKQLICQKWCFAKHYF